MRGQERITLLQCYEWAYDNYPQIQQYELIRQTEQYNLSNASKGWLPQLSVNAKASYQSDVTKLPFTTEMLSSILPGVQIPTLSKDQYQVVAEVNQTIWDGGAIHSSRKLTEAQATADREQLNSDLYILNDRVNQLYFGCLLQDELLLQNKLLQKELQRNIDRIDAMIANLKPEFSKVTDISNAQDVEQDINEYRNNLKEEHLLNLENNTYSYLTGVYYMDLINEYEHVGDFMINISEAIIEIK